MNDPETYISQNKYIAARSAALYWSQRVSNARADALDENNTAPPPITYTEPNHVPHYVVGTNSYTDNITRRIGRDVASYVTRFTDWQRNVLLAHTGGNPYESMRDVLNRVGIKAVNAPSYQNQFGIALHVQKPVEIGGGIHALMAEPVDNDTAVSTDIVPAEPMQALLTEARNTLGFNEGEYTMFIAAQPDTPPSVPSVVMVAQANPNQQAATKREHILGVCELVEMRGAGQAGLTPVVYANGYFSRHWFSLTNLQHIEFMRSLDLIFAF
jgi:hypothetical protein